jgi:hypothetical protein
MSWGTALAVYGAASSASAQHDAAQANSSYLNQEGRIASQESQSEEAITRNKNSVQQGDLAAAAAQAGLTTGPSTQAVARQSAINQELDALNVRYMGTVRANTYTQQAANVAASGNTAAMSSALRAGGALVSGIGAGYNGNYSLSSYAS